MDGRNQQENVLLARTLLKQAGEAVYQQYRALVEENPDYALNLVAGIMCLQRDDILNENIECLRQVPQHAFSIASALVTLHRADQHEMNNINDRLSAIHKKAIMQCAEHANKIAQGISHVYRATKKKNQTDFIDLTKNCLEFANRLGAGIARLTEYYQRKIQNTKNPKAKAAYKQDLKVHIGFIISHPEHALTLAAAICKLDSKGWLQECLPALVANPHAAQDIADAYFTLQYKSLLAFPGYATSLARGIVDFRQYNELEEYVIHLTANPEHAESLHRGFMQLFQHGLLSHAQTLLRHKEHADTIATALCDISKHPFLVKYRAQIFANVAQSRMVTHALIDLHHHHLYKLIPTVLEHTADSYQLTTGLIMLHKAGCLNSRTNLSALLKCSAKAAQVAEAIILLKKFNLSDYLEPMLEQPETISAICYVLSNIKINDALTVDLQNFFNKKEVITCIHRTYQTTCENGLLHFMALKSPAEKAQVILQVATKLNQRKALKSNQFTLRFAELTISDTTTQSAIATNRKY